MEIVEKIFVSIPMSGKTDTELINDLTKVYPKVLKDCYKLKKRCRIVDNFNVSESMDVDFNTRIIHKPLGYLSNAIYKLSQCSTIYMCKGWKKARGCRIEHQIAKTYGLKILYEK